MNEVTPITIKPEPDWSSYRSSFDKTDLNTHNAGNTTVSTMMPPTVYPVSGVNTTSTTSMHPPTLNAFDVMGNSSSVNNAQPKKKGRKKKIKEEPKSSIDGVPIKQEKITDTIKVRKKHDRFKGTTEEEVLQRVLPDHIAPNLDILIIGINPGLTAAYVGHHYAGPGNHFWKCLFLSGLIPEQMNAYDDYKLINYGIGFTNIVARTSRGSADLSKKEIKEGGEILKEKVKTLKPKIAVFNGKGIYEVFCGHKKFYIGKQPDPFPDCEETAVFVMPSSSARFTQLPRAIDKVPFYLALKKYRDHLKGVLPELSEEEISFPDLDLKVVPKAERLAKEKAEAEANGQFWPVKQETLSDGESKPKRGRKKKAPEPSISEEFNIKNQPESIFVKQEPGAVNSDCYLNPFTSYASHASSTLPQVTTSSGSPTCPSDVPISSGSTTSQPVPMQTPVTTYSQSVPSCELNFGEILQEGSSLVKQEDLTELTQYGINPHQLHTQFTAYSTSANSQPHYTNAQVAPQTQGQVFWPPMCTATAAMFASQGQLPNHSHYAMAAYNQGFSRHMGTVPSVSSQQLVNQSNQHQANNPVQQTFQTSSQSALPHSSSLCLTQEITPPTDVHNISLPTNVSSNLQIETQGFKHCDLNMSKRS